MKDDWVGVSWAHGVSNKWSLGVSIFSYERSFNRRARIDLRAIGETLDAAALEVQRSYGVKDKGFVGKLGIAWRHEKTSLGASLTLPYAGWSSKGSVGYENSAVGLPYSVGLPADNVLESSVQGGGSPWTGVPPGP